MERPALVTRVSVGILRGNLKRNKEIKAKIQILEIYIFICVYIRT